MSLNSGSSITLNISLGASGVFNQLSSFSATSTGYAPINVNGTGPSGGGWNNTPVTLTGPVLISANVNSNASVTILPNGTPYGTVSGQLSGSMSLAVVQPGMLTLAGPNTYSGGTYVIDGSTLAAGDVQSLGSGMVSLIGGTLSLQAASLPVQQYANNVVVDVSSTINVADSLNAGMGTLTFNGNPLTVTSTDMSGSPYSLAFGTTTVNGPVGLTVNSSGGGGAGTVTLGTLLGPGTLNVTGPGTVSLPYPGAISGGVTINSGLVIAGIPGAWAPAR